jgi:hypothetical protein
MKAQELDANHQADNEVAEAQLRMHEEWNDRQRQAHGEITAEKCCDDRQGRTGQVGRRRAGLPCGSDDGRCHEELQIFDQTRTAGVAVPNRFAR